MSEPRSWAERRQAQQEQAWPELRLEDARMVSKIDARRISRGELPSQMTVQTTKLAADLARAERGQASEPGFLSGLAGLWRKAVPQGVRDVGGAVGQAVGRELPKLSGEGFANEIGHILGDEPGPGTLGYAIKQRTGLGLPTIPGMGAERQSGTRIAETLREIPDVGPVAERTFQIGAVPIPGNSLKLAVEAAAGGLGLREGAKRAGLGEGWQAAADIAGSLAAPVGVGAYRSAVRAGKRIPVGMSVEDVGPGKAAPGGGDLPSFSSEGLTPATRELYGTLMGRVKTQGWTPGNVQAYKELTGRDISALRGTMLPEGRTATDIVAGNEAATARSLGGVPGQINPDMPFTGTPSETVQRLKYAIENGQAMNADALRQFRRGQAGGFAGASESGGRAGLYKGLGAMRGQAERVGIKPLSEVIGPQEQDALINQVLGSGLRPLERANAGQALDNLIQNGRIPTFSEMRLLNRVFGPEVIQNPLKAIGTASHPTFGDYMRDIVSLPQSLIANFDLSGLRQTATAAYGHPRMFAKQFRSSLEALKSEDNFAALQDDLANRWYAGLREDAGVRLTSGGERALAKGEGTLISDVLNRWLPGYRPSQRAYTTLVNGMRDGVFERMVSGYGVGVEDVPLAELRRWGKLANISTGSGELPAFLSDMRIADTPLFWAPRLFASRAQMPFEVFSKSAVVRKEAARQLVAFVGVNSAILGMLKASGAADVELDSRSADFGQVRLGNMRVDPWFGFRPVANLVARMATGEIKSSTSGEFSKDRKAILTDFLRQKLSPITATAANLWTGEDAIGQPYTGKDALGDLVTPLFFRDIVNAIQEGGKAAPLVGLAGLGVGVNSYTSPTAEVQAGRYATLKGEEQFNAIKAQAWKQTSAVPAFAPTAKYKSEYEFAKDIRAQIAPQLRAMKNPDGTAKYDPAEIPDKVQSILEKHPVYKAYIDARDQYRTKWVIANIEEAIKKWREDAKKREKDPSDFSLWNPSKKQEEIMLGWLKAKKR